MTIIKINEKCNKADSNDQSTRKKDPSCLKRCRCYYYIAHFLPNSIFFKNPSFRKVLSHLSFADRLVIESQFELLNLSGTYLCGGRIWK